MSIEDAKMNQATLTFAEKTLALIAAIRKEVKSLIKEMADSIYELQLSNYLDGGGIPGYIEVPYFYNELKEELKKNKIPHIECPLKEKFGRMFFIKAEDIEKVRDMYREILKQRSMVSEISKQEMMELKEGTNIMAVTDLDSVQTQVLREKAEKHMVMIAVDKLPNGKYNIYFEPEKRNEMQKMIVAMKWELSGMYGHKIREQIQYDIDNKQMIFHFIRSGLNNVCITSAKNTEDTIKINDLGYSLMKENKVLEQISIDNPEYEKKLWEAIELIDQPVILSDIEYAKEEQEREIIVKSRNERPKLSRAEINQLKREMQLRELVEKKMSLNNEEQTENLSDFFNYEVSFSEFFEHELVNQENNKEIIENMKAHYKEFVDELDNNRIIEIRVTPSLDRVILTAEERAKSDRGIDEKEKIR